MKETHDEQFDEAARETESRLSELFRDAIPDASFEDRMIGKLRETRPRRILIIHPAVRRAAIGIAAAVLLGGFGYFVNEAIESGGPGKYFATGNVKVASNLRQIGQPMLLYSNENKGAYRFASAPTTQPATPGFSLNSSEPALKDGDWDKNGEGTSYFGVAKKSGAGSLALNGGTFNGTIAGVGSGDKTDVKDNFAGGRMVTSGGVVGFGSYASKSGEETSHETRKAGNVYWDFNSVIAKESPVDSRFKPTEIALGTKVHEVADLVTQLHGATPAVEALVPGAKPQPPLPEPVAQADPARATLGKADDAPTTAPPTTQAPSRKIIRNGQLEFEVDRFDSAFARVSQLTREAGGYIGTTDSEKLPNGKVKGTVTVRVPPDRLDTLVLQLRGIGDLRSQKLEAQDVSKQYSDLDSELRAAKAMQDRLMEMIKTGKGEIKDLLNAEKELAVWRGKSEKIIGEMKFYDNLVSLSTLTITLYEKDIKTPAAAVETENIDAGVETEDVETARAEALKAIEMAKGRVIQSDMKRFDAGQFAATIVADVSPENAGVLLDRVKQLGRVARLDVTRKQTSDGASPAAAAAGTRVEKRDTRINLSLYNLANVARQSTAINLAAEDVEAVYKQILARVSKAGGRVVTSNLTRPRPDMISGTISFEVKTAEADAVLADVRAGGETMRLTTTENPDTNNVTTAKRGFTVSLLSLAGVAPRESTGMQIASSGVADSYRKLIEALRKSTARITVSQLNEASRDNVSAQLDFEIARTQVPAIETALREIGDVTQRTSSRSNDLENTVDSKVRLSVSLFDAERMPARETTTLSIEASDVVTAMADVVSAAESAGGKSRDSNLSKQPNGQMVGHVVLDVPLGKSGEIVAKAKGEGSVRAIDAAKNSQVPDSPLASARIDVTFSNAEALVEPGHGLWANIRAGLSTSFTGLLWSLQLIVVGLCFVAPWILAIVGVWKLIRRSRRAAPAA